MELFYIKRDESSLRHYKPSNKNFSVNTGLLLSELLVSGSPQPPPPKQNYEPLPLLRGSYPLVLVERSRWLEMPDN